MAESEIDLIPAEEKVRRSKEKAKKAALIVTVILFVLVLGLSVGLYVYTGSLDKSISIINGEVDAKKSRIAEKSQIEIAARNLDSKYKILSGLLENRLYYTLLLNELSFRTPDSISITSLDSSIPETVNLSGSATDYVSLAKFLNSLADPKLSSSSAIESDRNLFNEVLVNTVTLDPLSARPKFNLSLNIDVSLLKKK